MPDTLPPLVDAPDAALTPAQTAAPAAWAQRFGGSDTSLAQRNRHNADIQANVDAVQRAQAAHLQDSLQHDAGAQNLYFRQKQLDSLNDNRDQIMAMREQQFELAQKQKDGQLAISQAKLATQHAQADQVNAAASDLNDALTSGQIKAGTPEHAQFIAGLVGKYPAAATTPFMANALKSANIQADPQDILDRFNDLKSQLTPDTQITTDAKGVPHLVAKSQDQTDNLQARTANVQGRTAATAAQTDIAQQREARMQSQFQRKLSDADAAKEDTKGFMADAVSLEDANPIGSPEYKQGMRKLMADYPMADQKAIGPLVKDAGIGDAEQQARFDRAQDFREQIQTRAADQRDTAQTSRDASATASLQQRQQAQDFHQQEATAKDTIQQSRDLDKQIGAIEKQSPEWMGTTGIAPDKNGVERFGFPATKTSKKSFEESPQATPELKADYQHYQALLAQRAMLESGAKAVVNYKRVDGKLVPVQ